LTKNLPTADLNRVMRYLEALANQSPSFPWKPPHPRDARRFAKKLEKDAGWIRKMNLYFGSELPLGNPNYARLPEFMEQYAKLLTEAAGSRRKRRPPEDEDMQRELEILRLLDQSTEDGEHHHYEQAATLMQAAYNSGSVDRTVDADQLRKLYDRQSYRYRVFRKE
jgi:hypothetical protein